MSHASHSHPEPEERREDDCAYDAHRHSAARKTNMFIFSMTIGESLETMMAVEAKIGLLTAELHADALLFPEEAKDRKVVLERRIDSLRKASEKLHLMLA